jgi:hypothetical protein
LPLISNATIRYVTVNGAGAQDGTSWSNAAAGASLQAMIDASTSGDEVWVATGLYKPTNTTDRSIAFVMKNGVAIYGSFVGTETSLSQRVFTCGPGSVLSGGIGASTIDDNSYQVIRNGNGLTSSAILDGFEIREANDPRTPTNSEGLGGGIFNNGGAGASCNPTIRNCVITNNRAGFGAGIFNSGYNGGNASPRIENCIITNNHAYIGGGGLDNYGLSGNASPTILNTIFYENTAAQRAGGMYCWGGGNGNANPVVRNTLFVKNSAVDGGGVVSDRLNAGTGSSGNSNPVFTNCIFRNNSASGIAPHFFILGNATVNTTYSIINLTGQTTPHTLTGSTSGNLDTDPQFINIDNAIGNDGCWLTADDGLRLADTSPGVNAGTNDNAPATDIMGSTRIFGATIDMGPYESDVDVITAVDATVKVVSVYPNPASDKLYIDTHNGLPIERIHLNNVLGQSLQIPEYVASGSLDVSGLLPGIYQITVIQVGLATRVKWIKK